MDNHLNKLKIFLKMHAIFGSVKYWQIIIMRILCYFNFKVFYLYIDTESDIEKNEIAIKLKKNNIYPLPIELEKKIPLQPFSLLTSDPDQIAYKKNIKIVPDLFLKKYCNLFSIDNQKTKKLRLLIQDIISHQQRVVSAKLGIWSALYPVKKIVYISFKFLCFYNADTGKNIFKIVIPLDIFNYFLKIVKNKFSSFLKLNNKKSINKKNEISNSFNFEEIANKSVALITHKGLTYGSKENMLFEKSLYYSDNTDSYLNKYNILHLDYSNFSSPEKNIHWVCLKKVKFSKTQVLLKTSLACLKTLNLIRNWSTLLGWILCMKQYFIYIKYYEVIKKFKKLRIAIIEHDYLCPKTLLLALEKKKVKTISTQDRFYTTFYTSYFNVLLDTYYTASEYTAKFIKNSKYYNIKNLIPVGQYRSDYISSFKKDSIPEEISNAKEKGKKIIVVLGHHSMKHWFESNSEPNLNWSAQMSFLKDIIKLSKNLKNTFIILRYKMLNWTENSYFKSILEEIESCENIKFSNDYSESFYSLKLCANADLVIAKHTSLADECLSNEIPVLFYEYTHNLEKIFLDIINYLPSELICHNFEDLYKKSQSILTSSSNKWEAQIKELNDRVYYVKEKKNIKKRILGDLENQIEKINF